MEKDEEVTSSQRREAREARRAERALRRDAADSREEASPKKTVALTGVAIAATVAATVVARKVSKESEPKPPPVVREARPSIDDHGAEQAGQKAAEASDAESEDLEPAPKPRVIEPRVIEPRVAEPRVAEPDVATAEIREVKPSGVVVDTFDDDFDPDYFLKKRRQTDIAQKAAALIKSSADTYEDMNSDMNDRYNEGSVDQAQFFAPKELLDRQATKSPDPNADADIGRPRSPGESAPDYEAQPNFVVDSKGFIAPWPIPSLKLIEPTPPVSRANSALGYRKEADREPPSKRDSPSEDEAAKEMSKDIATKPSSREPDAADPPSVSPDKSVAIAHKGIAPQPVIVNRSEFDQNEIDAEGHDHAADRSDAEVIEAEKPRVRNQPGKPVEVEEDDSPRTGERAITTVPVAWDDVKRLQMDDEDVSSSAVAKQSKDARDFRRTHQAPLDNIASGLASGAAARIVVSGDAPGFVEDEIELPREKKMPGSFDDEADDLPSAEPTNPYDEASTRYTIPRSGKSSSVNLSRQEKVQDVEELEDDPAIVPVSKAGSLDKAPRRGKTGTQLKREAASQRTTPVDESKIYTDDRVAPTSTDPELRDLSDDEPLDEHRGSDLKRNNKSTSERSRESRMEDESKDDYPTPRRSRESRAEDDYPTPRQPRDSRTEDAVDDHPTPRRSRESRLEHEPSEDALETKTVPRESSGS